MAIHHPIGDLVSEATLLCDLDRNPPPMDFNSDFNIPKTPGLQVSNGFEAELGFLHNKTGFTMS